MMSPDKRSKMIQLTFKNRFERRHTRPRIGPCSSEDPAPSVGYKDGNNRKRITDVIVISDESDAEAVSPPQAESVNGVDNSAARKRTGHTSDSASEEEQCSAVSKTSNSKKRKAEVICSDESDAEWSMPSTTRKGAPVAWWSSSRTLAKAGRQMRITNLCKAKETVYVSSDESYESDDDDVPTVFSTIPSTASHRYATRSRKLQENANESLNEGSVDSADLLNSNKPKAGLHLFFASTAARDVSDAECVSDNEDDNESARVCEVTRNMFSSTEDIPQSTINQKVETFFGVYDRLQLFIQENYLNVSPMEAQSNIEHLERISSAADLLSWSDIIDSQIRSDQNWILMNEMAMFSAVLPTAVVKGSFHGEVKLPLWHRKFKKQNRFRRLVQQIQEHASCKARVGTNSANWVTDLAPALRLRSTLPLLQRKVKVSEAVKPVLDNLVWYNLTLEDRNAILMITKWPRQDARKVSSRMERALAKAYEKHSRKLLLVTDQVQETKNQSNKQLEGIDDDFDEVAPGAFH